MSPLLYALGQRLAITCSAEVGIAVARSQHQHGEPQYLLRYEAADGRATECWWAQSALEPAPAVDTAATADYPGAGFIRGVLLKAETSYGTDRPTPLASPPRIGEFWSAQGGLYAGVCRGAAGQPDHHLILANFTLPDRLDWTAAMAWAQQLLHWGHRDWALPTRAESALLFANLKAIHEPEWHWTCEQSSADSAWFQYFNDGGQGNDGKSFKARARAVRRLVLQSFTA